MGYQINAKGWCILMGMLSISIVYVNASSVERVEGVVYIDGKVGIAEIDENFICATLDWWPPEKCDYAFSPLKIRLGGSLQDKVIYESNDSKLPCSQFKNKPSEMFGFTPGCLPMKRWDELNAFFKKTGPLIVFGLNALTGRIYNRDGSASGAWDPSNAESLIRYTVEKGYPIHGWELGNELSGSGVGTRVAANQYSTDLITLNHRLIEIYKDSEYKPLVIAPGGFFDANWFSEFLNKTQNNSLDVITHHIYNLGPGVDPHLIESILNPSILDQEASTFKHLQEVIKSSGNPAVSWVGEAGGAYNSGRNHVTNAFVFSFWIGSGRLLSDHLDVSLFKVWVTFRQVVTRRIIWDVVIKALVSNLQTLIGGNYGLLNTTTFVPNPDYYSALLWHRLMGKTVLSVNFSGTKSIRAYAHCSKLSKGITLLFINLSGNTTVQSNVVNNGTYERNETGNVRSEYHLTAKDGELQSQVMLLNGDILTVSSSGEIPPFTPLHVNTSEPIVIGPFSIVFVHMPFTLLPACQ
ncbi:hypothetical protein KSS87_003434 [Heliosperma pusillum]|nr:hypothetical protein KSS87_003434 [Heliosperma pusillum]